MRLRLLLLVFLTGLASVIHAQVKLSGKIVSTKNEPVAGASIRILGATGGTTTDVEGRYSLSLLPGKKYELEFSAIGYAPKLINDIEVGPGLDNELNVVLEMAAKSIEGVTVRATSRRQENTTALLNFQKNHTAMSSGLAADFIRRTPDKNTGEVLRRVSGASIQDNKFVIVRGLSDRYNSALINGAQLPSSEPDKKAFSFDVIPSNLIDNIIINKTATPDLTGEFAGGLVQIQTKDIPTKNQLSFGASLGINTQSAFKDFISNERGSTDWLGFANRGLPAAYPKKYLEFNRLTQDEQLAIAHTFSDNVYRETQSTAGPIQQYNLTWSNAVRGRNGGALGSVLGITYRNAKQLYTANKELFEKGAGGQQFFDYTDQQNKYTVSWGAIANIAWSKKKHKIAFKNIFNQLLDDNYYRRTGINTENLQDISLRSSVLNQRSLLTSQLEGTHQVSTKNIKLSWNLNYAYNSKEQPDLRVQTYGKSIGTNNPYAINLRGNNTNRFFSELTDHAFGYNASASLPFNLGKQSQSLKIGGSATVRIRQFRAIILGYKEPTDQSLLNLPFDQIFLNQNFNETGFQLSTDLQNPQDKYFGVSALSAGYIMFDNKFSDKVRLIWGTRVENFEQVLKSNKSGTDKAQVIDTEKIDVLPSFNLTISPDTKTNLRIAASRTVARPEFREIAPFTFFDFEQIASTAGSPDLKRSSILNGDIRYELYPKAGELLSLGVFYKDFTDPIELRLNSASVATRRQYQFQNAEKAELFGIEAEFRKNLSFLSDNANWLKKLYFNGNVSVILSEVSLGNVDASGNKLPSTERPLQGQSPYLVNAGFQYDGAKGLNMSLLYNRIGQRLALVGNNDFGDIYEKPRDLVDFQLSQKILENKGELKITVSDILGQPYVSYENRDDNKVYKSSVDKIFSSYKPGTTITLGFTYNLDLK
ncbi:MAG TPA: carboxypeptidase regulatory-like domain-containing protein [Chitinophagaceae bacterium]|nr:carboxypeptidase regulatory-like domain-containing protein [Chitinophagaceae bacterium]